MTPVRYLDVQLEQGTIFSETLPSKFRGFVYMVEGQAQSGTQLLETHSAYFFECEKQEKDLTVEIEAINNSRFMVCFGIPHGESIFQHGPFVD